MFPCSLEPLNDPQLSEAVSILHAFTMLFACSDLSRINWALSISSLYGKIHVINFSYLRHNVHIR